MIILLRRMCIDGFLLSNLISVLGVGTWLCRKELSAPTVVYKSPKKLWSGKGRNRGQNGKGTLCQEWECDGDNGLLHCKVLGLVAGLKDISRGLAMYTWGLFGNGWCVWEDVWELWTKFVVLTLVWAGGRLVRAVLAGFRDLLALGYRCSSRGVLGLRARRTWACLDLFELDDAFHCSLRQGHHGKEGVVVDARHDWVGAVVFERVRVWRSVDGGWKGVRKRKASRSWDWKKSSASPRAGGFVLSFLPAAVWPHLPTLFICIRNFTPACSRHPVLLLLPHIILFTWRLWQVRSRTGDGREILKEQGFMCSCPFGMQRACWPRSHRVTAWDEIEVKGEDGTDPGSWCNLQRESGEKVVNWHVPAFLPAAN